MTTARTTARTTVVSLGSNLTGPFGPPEDALRVALDLLDPDRRGRVSPLVRTPPWGPVPQPAYANLVAALPAPVALVWERAVAAEAAGGRVRAERWGPRTLDIDVIDVTDVTGTSAAVPAGLDVPHPRAHERAFVLVPWLALDADAVLTGHGRVADLVAALPAADVEAVRVDPGWSR